MSKSSSLSRSLDIAATAIDDHVRWSGFDESSDSWEPYKALMHVDKLHDYAHSTGAQVATENLFQDFPGLFPAAAGFPLRFLVSETSHTSVVLTLCASLSSFIPQSHVHTCSDCLYKLQEERGTVTQQYVLSTYFMSLRPFHT